MMISLSVNGIKIDGCIPSQIVDKPRDFKSRGLSTI